MKSKNHLYFLLLFLLGISCAPEKDNPTASAINLTENVLEFDDLTVIRDCTGTYLRLNDKDYHVCNLEMVNSFPNGAMVKAKFKKIQVCSGSAAQAIVCYMLHENVGWIEIEKIE